MNPPRPLSFFLLVFLPGLFVACQSSKNVWVEEVKAVMKVHDEAMLLMDSIHELQLLLNGQLKRVGVQALDSAARTEVLAAAAALSDADDAMMDWMKGFEMPAQNTPRAEAMGYLAKEKEKITFVHEQMKAAIASGIVVQEKYAVKP